MSVAPAFLMTAGPQGAGPSLRSGYDFITQGFNQPVLIAGKYLTRQNFVTVRTHASPTLVMSEGGVGGELG